MATSPGFNMTAPLFEGRKWPAIVLAMFLVAALTSGAAAGADDDGGKASDPPLNKLTASYYDFSSGKEGVDVNLRHTFKSSTAWIGAYHESDHFDQARVGYEYDYHNDWLTFVPSVQAATHGFLGATVYAEAGRGLIGIVGMGRTNLQPYWNLGFDPNDYIQFGAGYVDRDGNRLSVSVIHDNRLNTGQTNTHVFFRRYLPRTWRLTVEFVNEHGNGDDGLVVNAWVKSVDVDWSRWVVRVAVDPHVNYTPDRQVRVAAGLRF
jgi:hypothetical protein